MSQPRPLEFTLCYGSRDHGLVWRVTSYPTLKFDEDHRMYWDGWDKPAARLVSVRFDTEKYGVDLHQYLHLETDPGRPATEGEREWLAAMYLSHDPMVRFRLLGVDRLEFRWLQQMLAINWTDTSPKREITLKSPSLGASPMAWGFPDIDAQEISRRYGDGRQIFITAPVSEDGVTLLRGSHPVGDDDIAHREAMLENAVEDGRIVGAMPADI